jgi:hypothetical protein
MLFTINGHKLQEIKPSDTKLSMQIRYLSPGLYLLKIIGENRKTLTGKIMLRQ